MAVGAARRDTARRTEQGGEEEEEEDRRALMKSEGEGEDAVIGAAAMNSGVDIVTTQQRSEATQAKTDGYGTSGARR